MPLGLSKRVVAVFALLVFAAGVGVGATAWYLLARADAHYEPGFARIDGYSLDAGGRTLVLSTPVGSGDLLLGHHVNETSEAVTVTVRASIYVPSRNTFKHLTASLDTTRIELGRPLGARMVIDGASGRTVPRIP